MRQIKNIEISQKTDRNIQQGESCFKYIVLAFVAVCWLCRDISHSVEPVSLLKPVVYHTERGQDTSLINLIGDWFQ